MPTYSSKEDFLERFFIPVVMKAWKYLQKGGYMALNMPTEMYDAIRGLLPKRDRIIKMAISNRFGSGASYEPIFVWKKS